MPVKAEKCENGTTEFEQCTDTNDCIREDVMLNRHVVSAYSSVVTLKESADTVERSILSCLENVSEIDEKTMSSPVANGLLVDRNAITEDERMFSITSSIPKEKIGLPVSNGSGLVEKRICWSSRFFMCLNDLEEDKKYCESPVF